MLIKISESERIRRKNWKPVLGPLSDLEFREEEIYRSQLKVKWARRPGNPLLKSMTRTGKPVEGVFGKVDVVKDEG